MTFLTGFFGQNFSWTVGRLGGLPVFAGVGIGLQVLVAVALVVLFRGRGWLTPMAPSRYRCRPTGRPYPGPRGGTCCTRCRRANAVIRPLTAWTTGCAGIGRSRGAPAVFGQQRARPERDEAVAALDPGRRTEDHSGTCRASNSIARSD
jgi:hypothetical protein